MPARYEGRRFRGIENYEVGDFNKETVFRYYQRDKIGWVLFEGCGVEFGTALGIETDSGALDLVFQYLSKSGETKIGKTNLFPSVLPDGRLRLDERWVEGDFVPRNSGTAVVEEEC